ncbi:MAG TPA: MATE family efflux transporter [Gemmataceae bacterium]|nr:MATE family efflux transporter [Gemmataceae bacterium]
MPNSTKTIDKSEAFNTPSSGGPAPAPRFLQVIWQAIRGTHISYDYTEGDLGHSIMLLAVPMVLEMLMESVFAVVDVFFVARLGPEAVAAVAITESLMTLIYTLAIGLGIGAMALVARRIGGHDPEGASSAAAQTIAIGILVSVVVGVAGAAFAPNLLAMMGASSAVVEKGTGFTRMMLAGNASVMLLFLVNSVFRGAGDAVIAMRVLWLANALNILLGPCLIFGLGPFPELGVTGAAVATTIGRGTGTLYAFSRLLRPGARVRLVWRNLRLEPSVMLGLIRLSGIATFQVFIGMASWIGLVRILAGFGDAALAGNAIGLRIIMFALLPSWGLSNAAATLVGQALGAGKPERAEQAVWRASFYNMCFLGAVGLLFVVFADPIVSVFTQASGPDVHRYGSEALRTIACGFLFYAYGMVITQSFNGAGDTWTPTIINLIVFWLWEIPLAYILAFEFGLGPRGVFLAVTIAFSTLALVSAYLFRKGRWKTKVV